ncbi:MAG: hypothetical protein ACP5XB_29415, partial [Isosphaeraceae bacterium]
MSDVNLWQSAHVAVPLIIAGTVALSCGLISLLAFFILLAARRLGEGRGPGWLGVVAGLLLVIGIVLFGAGAVNLAPAARAELAKARLWFERQHSMSRDALRSMAAQEVRALLDGPKHREPKDLNRHEFQAFSQNGEDGIIAEIFQRIGVTNRYFVEFGASDGFENNTALLVRPLGWRGLWIDGSPGAIRRAHEH